MNLLNRNSSYQVPEKPIKILYTANTCRKKEKSRNPHDFWTFLAEQERFELSVPIKGLLDFESSPL